MIILQSIRDSCGLSQLKIRSSDKYDQAKKVLFCLSSWRGNKDGEDYVAHINLYLNGARQLSELYKSYVKDSWLFSQFLRIHDDNQEENGMIRLLMCESIRAVNGEENTEPYIPLYVNTNSCDFSFEVFANIRNQLAEYQRRYEQSQRSVLDCSLWWLSVKSVQYEIDKRLKEDDQLDAPLSKVVDFVQNIHSPIAYIEAIYSHAAKYVFIKILALELKSLVDKSFSIPGFTFDFSTIFAGGVGDLTRNIINGCSSAIGFQHLILLLRTFPTNQYIQILFSNENFVTQYLQLNNQWLLPIPSAEDRSLFKDLPLEANDEILMQQLRQIILNENVHILLPQRIATIENENERSFIRGSLLLLIYREGWKDNNVLRRVRALILEQNNPKMIIEQFRIGLGINDDHLLAFIFVCDGPIFKGDDYEYDMLQYCFSKKIREKYENGELTTGDRISISSAELLINILAVVVGAPVSQDNEFRYSTPMSMLCYSIIGSRTNHQQGNTESYVIGFYNYVLFDCYIKMEKSSAELCTDIEQSGERRFLMALLNLGALCWSLLLNENKVNIDDYNNTKWHFNNYPMTASEFWALDGRKGVNRMPNGLELLRSRIFSWYTTYMTAMDALIVKGHSGLQYTNTALYDIWKLVRSDNMEFKAKIKAPFRTPGDAAACENALIAHILNNLLDRLTSKRDAILQQTSIRWIPYIKDALEYDRCLSDDPILTIEKVFEPALKNLISSSDKTIYTTTTVESFIRRRVSIPMHKHILVMFDFYFESIQIFGRLDEEDILSCTYINAIEKLQSSTPTRISDKEAERLKLLWKNFLISNNIIMNYVFKELEQHVRRRNPLDPDVGEGCVALIDYPVNDDSTVMEIFNYGEPRPKLAELFGIWSVEWNNFWTYKLKEKSDEIDVFGEVYSPWNIMLDYNFKEPKCKEIRSMRNRENIIGGVSNVKSEVESIIIGSLECDEQELDMRYKPSNTPWKISHEKLVNVQRIIIERMIFGGINIDATDIDILKSKNHKLNESNKWVKVAEELRAKVKKLLDESVAKETSNTNENGRNILRELIMSYSNLDIAFSKDLTDIQYENCWKNLQKIDSLKNIEGIEGAANWLIKVSQSASKVVEPKTITGLPIFKFQSNSGIWESPKNILTSENATMQNLKPFMKLIALMFDQGTRTARTVPFAVTLRDIEELEKQISSYIKSDLEIQKSTGRDYLRVMSLFKAILSKNDICLDIQTKYGENTNFGNALNDLSRQAEVDGALANISTQDMDLFVTKIIPKSMKCAHIFILRQWLNQVCTDLAPAQHEQRQKAVVALRAKFEEKFSSDFDFNILDGDDEISDFDSDSDVPIYEPNRSSRVTNEENTLRANEQMKLISQTTRYSSSSLSSSTTFTTSSHNFEKIQIEMDEDYNII